MQFTIRKLDNKVSFSLKNIINAFGPDGNKKVLDNLADVFVNMTHDNFGVSGQYRDKTWPAYSKNYAKKVGSTTPTLLRSRALYNSITKGQNKDGSIQIYSNNKYAAAQMFGSKKTGLPARNYFPVEFASPTLSRPVVNADRQLQLALSLRLNQLSSGALPFGQSTFVRNNFSYGNIFSGS